MVCTIRIFFVLLLFCSFAYSFDYDVVDEGLILKIKVDNTLELTNIKKEKSAVDCLFEGGKGEIFARDFIGLPVSRIKSFYEKPYYHIYIEFVRNSTDVKIKKNGNLLIVNIPFEGMKEVSGGVSNPYVRIIFALIVTLLLIFVFFIFLKALYRKKVNAVIPGVGRVVGKMDVSPGMSILFVEIGSYLYLLSLSNNGIGLIDKIEDEEEILKIKSNFSKFQDFSSYLRFFGKKISKDEIEVTKTIVKEKVESLRKK